jgi:hypothetical protein
MLNRNFVDQTCSESFDLTQNGQFIQYDETLVFCFFIVLYHKKSVER